MKPWPKNIPNRPAPIKPGKAAGEAGAEQAAAEQARPCGLARGRAGLTCRGVPAASSSVRSAWRFGAVFVAFGAKRCGATAAEAAARTRIDRSDRQRQRGHDGQ